MKTPRLSLETIPTALAMLAVLLTRTADAQENGVASKSGRVAERATTADGRTIAGLLTFDPSAGFRFVPDGGVPIPLDKVETISFDGPGPDSARSAPPSQVRLGGSGRVSGRLLKIGESDVVLDVGPEQGPLRFLRGGVVSVTQRPGEALALSEGFESLDLTRWIQTGEPAVVESPHLAGSKALRLPAGGASLSHALASPIVAGRLELAYNDDAAKAAGQRWFVDLTFRGRSDAKETIRVVPGWAGESPAVESLGGPPLPVQRLARRPGWHRLGIKFGPERTDLALDGDELAHGAGPGGNLIELRLATEPASRDAPPPPQGLTVHVDDLRLVRLGVPPGNLAVEPLQDEVRLLVGDQVFGHVPSADADRIDLTLDTGKVALSWSEVAGIYFRRAPAQSAPIEGLWARVEWRPGAGNDARDLDRVEGALRQATDSALTIDVPYIGPLVVRRDQLRSLRVLPGTSSGRSRRMVIDPNAHHLGNETRPDLDPPQAEGNSLEVSFTLAAVPAEVPFIALDVIQAEGFEGSSFSELVRAGQLTTTVKLNGESLGDINRHVKGRNDSPQRLLLAVPGGTLRAGKNVLRIEQAGTKSDPQVRDNLGLLGIALEFAP